MMNIDIEEIIHTLIDQNGSIDFVESEFARMIDNDSELKNAYKEWCDDLGYSQKSGYKDYIEEVFESQDSVWDTLTEFEDEN